MTFYDLLNAHWDSICFGFAAILFVAAGYWGKT